MNELVPEYLAKSNEMGVQLDDKHFENEAFMGMDHHLVHYVVGDPDEHWEVTGPYTSGRIPLPPVTMPPGDKRAQTGP